LLWLAIALPLLLWGETRHEVMICEGNADVLSSKPKKFYLVNHDKIISESILCNDSSSIRQLPDQVLWRGRWPYKI
jgi:hypothetical protein